jgi:hypothetical protein
VAGVKRRRRKQFFQRTTREQREALGRDLYTMRPAEFVKVFNMKVAKHFDYTSP